MAKNGTSKGFVVMSGLNLIANRMRARIGTLTRLITRVLEPCAKDVSGSVAIEYVLFASGLGVTITGALAFLGVDVGALYQALDTPLCEHLALRVDCRLPF